MAKIRYAGLNYNDMVNGEGVCVSLFTQGCPFHCPGCHNPETWDFAGGKEIEEQKLIDNILSAISANGIIRNFSLLGGEPLCEQNYALSQKIITIVRENYANIKIFCWTGYELSSLQANSKFDFLFEYADVIIAGPYIAQMRDITLPLCGSSNQIIWRKQ